MTLGDKNGIFNWEETKEDETGYYFVLCDTLHHNDYNIVLFKDDGRVTVNGDYINNVPHNISSAILPRLDYFMALKKIAGQRKAKHEEPKKENKKPEPKKETKKEDKKPEAKKDDKKEDKKKTK